MFRVTVIIPSWNRCVLLERLLHSLERQTLRAAQIIVIDNGSSDGSAEMAQRLGARVLEMGRNAGFSPAVNQGIREVRTEWLAVLNNDVEPEETWLERLVRAAESAGAWFAAGKLLNPSRRDSIDGTFDTLCRGACPWRAGHGRKDGPLWTEQRRINFAPFTAALFRTDLFARIGNLDERFESYLEDVDFGLRCALGGYSGIYVPESVAYHTGSATLGAWHRETVRRMARNQLFLVAKHYPRRLLRRYAWPILVSQLLWGLVAFRHGRALSYLQGKRQGLTAFRALRAETSPEQTLQSVLEQSEREILRLQRASGFDAYWRLYFALTSLA